MAQSAQDDRGYLQRYGDKLSDTTRRAKWIGNVDEHEDHDGQTLATRNHDVIRHWAEERGGRPATIAGTGPGDRPGVLRFDFPGYDRSSKLEEIAWDSWFETFDTRDLVFDFQECLRNGNQSNFFKFDSPHRENE